MIRKRSAALAAFLALGLAAVPAAAQQFSDSFSFLKAVKERDGTKVTELLSNPSSTVVNTRDRSTGESALHYVVRERDLTWLSFLLAKGARPDLGDRAGNTPLGLAAQIGWAEGAQVLLSRKAGVDTANSRGETPLMFAVQKRDVPMVRLLLGAGANPNRTDSVSGYSALDYAKRDGRAAAIVRLLEAKPEKPKEAAGPVL